MNCFCNLIVTLICLLLEQYLVCHVIITSYQKSRGGNPPSCRCVVSLNRLCFLVLASICMLLSFSWPSFQVFFYHFWLSLIHTFYKVIMVTSTLLFGIEVRYAYILLSPDPASMWDILSSFGLVYHKIRILKWSNHVIIFRTNRETPQPRIRKSMVATC